MSQTIHVAKIQIPTWGTKLNQKANCNHSSIDDSPDSPAVHEHSDRLSANVVTVGPSPTQTTPSFNCNHMHASSMQEHCSMCSALQTPTKPSYPSPINTNNNSLTCILAQKGYKLLCRIRDTSQGSLYQALRLKDNRLVAIKVTSKQLHRSKTTKPDEYGMKYITDQDILLQSIILHYLTAIKSSIAQQYISQFVDFFEDASHDGFYYLVTEYVGSMTLRAFSDACHHYIRHNRLDFRQYAKTIKYIFWQLSVTTNFLQELNCCHLNLNMENIMIQNAGFTVNEDGSLSLNTDVNIKIVGFGLAEVFKHKTGDLHHSNTVDEDTKMDSSDLDTTFLCNKHLSIMLEHNSYISPKAVDGQCYHARKADVWSMGIILFTLTTGTEPYQLADPELDAGYEALQNSTTFTDYLRRTGYLGYFTAPLLQIVTGLLNVDESQRINLDQVLQSSYLSPYYHAYRDKLNHPSRLNKIAKYLTRPQMQTFPFYQN